MTATTRYVLAAAAVVVIVLGGVFAFRRAPAPASVLPVPSAPAPSTAAPPAPAPANCLMPGPAPVPPDGNTATAADMKLGHDSIQGFVVALETFQACRMRELDHASPGVTPQQKQTWLDEGNSAVDQANALASAFAVQLKAFKARAPQQR